MPRTRPIAAAACAAAAVVAGVAAIADPPPPRLLVLVDTTSSMARTDGGDASRLAQVDRTLRARAPAWSRQFAVAVRPFDSALRGPVAPDQIRGCDVHAGGPFDLGAAIGEIGASDETPLAAVVMFSDGDFAERPSLRLPDGPPVHVVGVGSPDRLPRRTTDLRGPDFVYSGAAATFTYEVARGTPADIRPTAAVLDEDGAAVPGSTDGWAFAVRGTTVTARRWFDRAGRFVVRLGVEPPPGEPSESGDTTLRRFVVAEVAPRVLYVEGRPRWEFLYLRNALTRDGRLAAADFVLLSGDDGSRDAPVEPPGGLPTQELLRDHDVLILGDVEITGPDGDRFARDVSAFVEAGGGLVLIAGPMASPLAYRHPVLEKLLPVEPAAENAPDAPTMHEDAVPGFDLRPTEAGLASDVTDVARDAQKTRDVWMADAWQNRQYWAYPTPGAKNGTTVLVVSDAAKHETAAGPRPVVCHRAFGAGHVWFVGVEELWRMRREFQDRYFYGFYRGVLRDLSRQLLPAPQADTRPPPVAPPPTPGEPDDMRLDETALHALVAEVPGSSVRRLADLDGLDLAAEREHARSKQVRFTVDEGRAATAIALLLLALGLVAWRRRPRSTAPAGGG